jgi:prevent-host-death family protein
MSGQVSIADAKARFASLVSRAQAGEKIIVTRNGKPVACLGPLPEPEPVEFGDLEGLYLAEDLSIPEDIIDEFYRKRS